MSRWSDAYTKHPFQSEWKALLKLLPELKIDDESILTSVEELARLRKAIKYIEGLLNALDVDLVPLGTWDNFQGQSSGCLQQIREYQQNRNIGHLQNANASADTALATLVDAGKLSWDDRVIDRLPGFQMYDPWVTREMTVRDLLVHRSGLGLGAGDLLFVPRSNLTRAETVRRLR